MTVPVSNAYEAEVGTDSGARAADDIRNFVGAIAVAMRETLAAFEHSVSRVTEMTVLRPGRADRELVVALQDFDRLQQEFASLGDVLARLAEASASHSAGGQGADEPHHPAFAHVSVADLKERLSYHLRTLTGGVQADPLEGDEVEF